MWKYSTIISKLQKAGIVLTNDRAVGSKYTLRLCKNGTGENALFFIALEDKADPSRIEYDHFTARYPQTIKEAIRIFFSN